MGFEMEEESRMVLLSGKEGKGGRPVTGYSQLTPGQGVS